PRVLQEVELRAERLVRDYRNPETGRVGSGVFLLRGGPAKLAQPTMQEFARLLVIGAARIGPARVAELVGGWVDDEPLRTRKCALIEGIGVKEDLTLPEHGVRLSRMPLSKGDLPGSFPEGSDLSLRRLRRGVLLSVDHEARPALYRPNDIANTNAHWNLRTQVPAGHDLQGYTLDGFCQHLALATNNYVGWNLQWEDLGELGAFSLSGGRGFGYGPDFGARGTGITGPQLEDAVWTWRSMGGLEEGSQRKFGIALNRWVQSKRQGMLENRIIDLRVTLEALYAVERYGKRRQTADHSALHLGGTPDEQAARKELIWRLYEEASEIVHAGVLDDEKEADARLGQAQDVCRGSLLKVLNDGGFPDWRGSATRGSGR
ncbi:MAG: hypothetical protein OXC11_10470, partial [Rhodospirillales bacterium]|nr:hypothetical protein [Rhodospirillales bacterium]